MCVCAFVFLCISVFLHPSSGHVCFLVPISYMPGSQDKHREREGEEMRKGDRHKEQEREGDREKDGQISPFWLPARFLLPVWALPAKLLGVPRCNFLLKSMGYKWHLCEGERGKLEEGKEAWQSCMAGILLCMALSFSNFWSWSSFPLTLYSSLPSPTL